MRKNWSLILAMILTLGIGTLLVTPASRAADADQIDTLIRKLGSDDFTERENAQESLQSLGMAAFDALKSASTSRDREIRRRAFKLLKKLNSELHTIRTLKPTLVELSYNDTPLKLAMADFAKKTGCTLLLADAKSALSSKKITLTTGKVTFWEAYDRFCQAAGLVEGTIQDLQQARKSTPGGGYSTTPNGGIPVPPGFNPRVIPQNNLKRLIQKIPIQQKLIAPVRIKPAVKKAAPVAKPAIKKKAAPAKKPVVQEKAAPRKKVNKAAELKKAELIKKLQLEKQKAAQQVAQAARLAQIAKQLQAQVQAMDVSYRPYPVQPTLQSGERVVKTGSGMKFPTLYVGAVRIRILLNQLKSDNDHYILPIELTPEPKLQWQGLDSVVVRKAIDNGSQQLLQTMDVTSTNPNVYGGQFGFGGGMAPGIGIRNWRGGGYYPQPTVTSRHISYLRLKKGKKASTLLNELSGNFCIRILSPVEKLLTLKNLSSKAKLSVTGKKGGKMSIQSITKQSANQIVVQMDLDRPMNAIATTNVQQAIGLGNNVKFQQVRQLGLGMSRGYQSNNGIVLFDQSNKPIRQIGMSSRARSKGDGTYVYSYTIYYQLTKGQTPSEMSFIGRMPQIVKVTNTFKKVKLK